MPGLMTKYFVLKPAGDDIYAKASRMAMRKYADAIREENPEFAQELDNWAAQETAERYARSLSPSPQETE